MRKTWRSRNTLETTCWSARAESRSVPNGFSMMHAHVGGVVAVQARPA